MDKYLILKKIRYWDGTKDTEWWESVENDTDIYIHTPEQFAAISSTDNKVFHLMSDLYFNEKFKNNFDWDENPTNVTNVVVSRFQNCVFNGNFKKIVGLYRYITDDGCFILTFLKAAVRNLVISNATSIGVTYSACIRGMQSSFTNVSFYHNKAYTTNSSGHNFTGSGLWIDISNVNQAASSKLLNLNNLGSWQSFSNSGQSIGSWNSNMTGHIVSYDVRRTERYINSDAKFLFAANCKTENRYNASFNFAEPVMDFNSSVYGVANISDSIYGIYSANNTGMREPHFGEDVSSVSEIVDKINNGLMTEQNPELSLLNPDGSFTGKNYLGEAISTATVSSDTESTGYSILKFGKSILKKNSAAGLLYYTRFLNITSGLTDTPLVGGVIDWQYTQLENRNIPSFEPESNNFLRHQSQAQKHCNVDLLDYIEPPFSIEYFMIGSGASDYGFSNHIYLNGSQKTDLNFTKYRGNYLRLGSSSLNNQVFNGAQIISEWGNKCIVPISICPAQSLFHYALVFKDDKIYNYINGLLMFIDTRSLTPGALVLGRFSGRTSDCWGSISNLAVWGLDRSSKDGLTYPVPTKPYK